MSARHQYGWGQLINSQRLDDDFDGCGREPLGSQDSNSVVGVGAGGCRRTVVAGCMQEYIAA